MISSISRFIFTCVVFAILNCEAAIPDICAHPPLVNPHECCDAPSIFDKAIMTECGLDPTSKEEEPDRVRPPACDKLLCLFKKEKLMLDDERLDLPAVKAYLSKWVETNPDWAVVSTDATQHCYSEHMLQHGPPDLCQPFKISYCLAGAFFSSCPAKHWKDSMGCGSLKKFMDECHIHDQQ